jgi:anti-sigma-K factor RskA
VSDIDIHHLGAAYALDALDERERMAFEAHYPSCEVCRADVIDFRSTIAHLAEASSAPPPPGLRARVMAEIAETRQLSPLLPAVAIDLSERRRRRQRWTSGLMASAAAVALVAGTLVVAGGGDEPAYSAELESILSQDDARFVMLVNTGADGGDASVKVAWSDTAESAMLLADGLPAAPDGQAYELWLIGDGDPIPMSLLDDAADGQLRQTMDISAKPQAWGITIEPDTGSTVPTGEVLYLSEA